MQWVEKVVTYSNYGKKINTQQQKQLLLKCIV